MYKLDYLAKSTSEKRKTHNHFKNNLRYVCFANEIKLFYMMCLLASILTEVLETQISEKNIKI